MLPVSVEKEKKRKGKQEKQMGSGDSEKVIHDANYVNLRRHS